MNHRRPTTKDNKITKQKGQGNKDDKPQPRSKPTSDGIESKRFFFCRNKNIKNNNFETQGKPKENRHEKKKETPQTAQRPLKIQQQNKTPKTTRRQLAIVVPFKSNKSKNGNHTDRRSVFQAAHRRRQSGVLCFALRLVCLSPFLWPQWAVSPGCLIGPFLFGCFFEHY